MISQTVEYALRAMSLLAGADTESLTVPQLAERSRVPSAYLAKLMQGLVRAGLVQSRRGIGGGFSLRRPVGEITLWDIVEAVDPIQRIKSCPLGIAGHAALCPLHRRLDRAMALVEEALRTSTLADLRDDAPLSGPLCREGTAVVPLGEQDLRLK